MYRSSPYPCCLLPHLDCIPKCSPHVVRVCRRFKELPAVEVPLDRVKDETDLDVRPNVIKIAGNDYAGCLAHLYRGEMGRKVTYLQRLDVSTQWAFSTTSALSVYLLGSGTKVHHSVFALVAFVNIGFWTIESR